MVIQYPWISNSCHIIALITVLKIELHNVHMFIINSWSSIVFYLIEGCIWMQNSRRKGGRTSALRKIFSFPCLLCKCTGSWQYCLIIKTQ